MIELLNRYRAAKESSAQAATELGHAFGAAFEQSNRNTEEFQLPEFDDLTLSANRLNDLNVKFSFAVERALGGFVGNEGSNLVVGVNLHNQILSKIEGSRVLLEEAPFVQGFVEGFRQSRHQRD